jgi:hypothetical protein
VFCNAERLPPEHFLRDHWHERDEKKVLLRRPVETRERRTRSLTIEVVGRGYYQRHGWQEIADGIEGKGLRIEDGIRIPSRLIRMLLFRDVPGILGRNFSLARKDRLAINGFDEEYRGPVAGKTPMFRTRPPLSGWWSTPLHTLPVQHHLWLPLTRVAEANRQRLAKTVISNNPRCRMWLEHL